MGGALHTDQGRRKAVLRNVAIVWIVSAALLAAANTVPAIGDARWRSAIVGLVLLAGLAIVMGSMARRLDRTRLPREWGIGMDRRTALRLAIGASIGLAMIGLQLGNIALVGDIAVVRNPQFDGGLIVPLTLSFLAWAAVEEIAFRSYPLFRLTEAFGFWRAQLAVALVFATYHVAGGVPIAQALIGTGLGSLAFGAVALASRGLAVPIGMHAAWNIGEWLLGSKGERFPAPWRIDISDPSAAAVQIAGTFGYLVLFAAATLGGWLVYRTRCMRR